MKIVYIHNLYPPHARGGAERVVYQWARKAHEHGNSTVVISWRPWSGWGSWRPERDEEDGVIVYRYWVPNFFSYKHLAEHTMLLRLAWHAVDLRNVWSTRIIKKILQHEQPDEVQTHNLMGIGCGVPRMIQRLGFSHSHVLHDVQLVEPSGILPWNHAKDSLTQRMYSAVMRWKMGKPTTVISMSHFLMQFYQQLKFFRDSAWRLAPHAEVVSVETKHKPFRRFLFVGGLHTHKGIDILMKAWQSIENSRITLDIVGDGEHRDALEQWAATDSRVTMHGWLSPAALIPVYTTADVLLFPSVCLENRPTVIVEAIAHGLFVIASRTGGVPELVTGENALLIEPDDAKALSKAIRACL